MWTAATKKLNPAQIQPLDRSVAKVVAGYVHHMSSNLIFMGNAAFSLHRLFWNDHDLKSFSSYCHSSVLYWHVQTNRGVNSGIKEHFLKSHLFGLHANTRLEEQVHKSNRQQSSVVAFGHMIF